jgi:hypothetical protein
MKQTLRTSLTALMISLTLGLSAQTTQTAKETPATLSLVGWELKQPVFQLQFGNEDREWQFITVRDQFGMVLHEEGLNDYQVNRRFRLDVEDLEGALLQITVSNRRRVTSVFYLNVKTLTVEEGNAKYSARR